MTRVFRYMLICLFAGFVATSCTKNKMGGSGSYTSQPRTETGFTGIENSGDFKIILLKSNTFSIDVHGEDNILPDIVTSVKDGILKVEYKKENVSYHHGLVTITIHAPLIDHIELKGSGSVESDQTWTIPAFSANVKGSGFIRYATIAKTVELDIDGSGFMSVSGNAQQARFDISGSGNIHAFDLVAKEATVSISGSGTAELTVLSKLNASINGSGSIFYKGNPQVSKHITGSGSLVKH